MPNENRLVYEVVIDFSKVQAQWESLVDKFRRDLQEVAGNIDRLVPVQSMLAGVREGLRNVVNELQRSLATTDASGIGKIATEHERVRQAVAAAKKEVSQFTNYLHRAFSASEWVKASLASFGIVFGAYGIIQAFRGAVRSAAEFDTRMREIWTLLDISENKFERLKEQVVELSRRIPLSTRELAEGIYWALSAGLPRENVIQAIEQISKAAIAGLTSLKDTTDVVTTALNAYGMSVENTARVTDVLFRGVTLSKTTFQELVTSIGPILPVAADLGVSLEEVTAALATLANMGISTARAATYVNQALVRILSPTREAEETAKQLGIQFNASAVQAMGFVNYLRYLKEAVGDNSEALANLFENVRAMRAVFALVSPQGMEMFTRTLREIQNSAGATEKAFQKMNDALSYEAQRFKNIWSALFKSEGFREFLSFTLGTINTISEAITGVGKQLDMMKTALERYANLSNQIAARTNEVQDVIERLSTTEDFLARSTQSLQEQYEGLTAALDEYLQLIGMSYVSKETYLDLSEEEERIIKRLQADYPALASSLEMVGDAYTANKDKLLDYMRAQLANMQLQLKYIDLVIQEQEQIINTWQEKKEYYESEKRSFQERRDEIEKTIRMYERLERETFEAGRAIVWEFMQREGLETWEDLRRTFQSTGFWQALANLPPTTDTFLGDYIEMFQRVYQTVIHDFLRNWLGVARTHIENLSEEQRTAVEGAFKELEELLSQPLDVTNYKAVRNRLLKFTSSYKDLLQLLGTDVVDPLAAFAQEVLRPYTSLQALVEAVAKGLDPMRDYQESLRTQLEAVDAQIESLDTSIREADMQIELATARRGVAMENLEIVKKRIQEFENTVNEIAEQTPETIRMQGVLRYAETQINKVMGTYNGILKTLSALLKRQITSIDELSLDIIRQAEGISLEEIAEALDQPVRTLQGQLQALQAALAAVPTEMLTEEQREAYSQLTKTVTDLKAQVEAAQELLDIGSQIGKYTIRQYRDLATTVTQVSQRLLKDFGIALNEVADAVAEGTLSLPQALDKLEEVLAQHIQQTGVFGRESAEKIASEVTRGVENYIEDSVNETVTTIKEGIDEALSAPTIVERIRGLVDLLQRVPQERERVYETLKATVGNQIASLAVQNISETTTDVTKALQDVILEAARKGIDIRSLFEEAQLPPQVFDQLVADLWSQYTELVSNFQRQLREKYRAVFNKEMTDVQTAITELVERAPRDKADEIQFWVYRIESLRSSLANLAMVLDALGVKVDVVKDFGGYMTSLRQTLSAESREFEKLTDAIEEMKASLAIVGVESLEQVMSKLDYLQLALSEGLGRSLRIVDSTLSSLYIRLQTGAAKIEDIPAELRQAGVNTAEAVQELIRSLGVTQIGLDNFSSGLQKFTRDLDRASEEYEELKSVLSEGVDLETLMDQGVSLVSIGEQLEDFGDSIEDLKGRLEDLNKWLDFLAQTLEKLPQPIKDMLAPQLEVISQLGGLVQGLSEQTTQLEQAHSRMATQFAQVNEELARRVIDTFDTAENALKSRNVDELVEAYNKLFQLPKIPEGVIIEGTPARVWREQLDQKRTEIRNTLENYLETLESDFEKQLQSISIFRLMEQAYKEEDISGVLEVIKEKTRILGLESLKAVVENIKDPQLRLRLLERIRELEEQAKQATKPIVFEVLRGIVGGEFDQLLTPAEGVLDFLKELETQIRNLAEEAEKAGESTDELYRILNRLKSYESRLVEEDIEQTASNIRAVTDETLSALQRSSKGSVQGVKAAAGALWNWVSEQMNELIRKYPDEADRIVEAFREIFERIAETADKSIEEIERQQLRSIEIWMDSISELKEGLTIDNLERYFNLVRAAYGELQKFEQQIADLKLGEKFAEDIRRAEEQFRSLLEIDFAKMLRPELPLYLEDLDRLLSILIRRKQEFEEYGIDISESLQGLVDDFTQKIYEFFTGLGNIPQFFNQYVLQPLLQTFVEQWLISWQRALQESQGKTQGFARALKALVDTITKNVPKVLELATATLLSAADRITQKLVELSILKPEQAAVIESGISGAQLGWGIGSSIGTAIGSTVLGPIGALVGGFSGLLFGAWSQKRKEEEARLRELEQKVQSLHDSLYSSVYSAIESALREVDLEKFTERLREGVYDAVRSAVIRALIDKYVAGMIDKLIAPLIDTATGELRLPTEQELEQMRSIIENIFAGAESIYDIIRKLFPELYTPEEGREWTETSTVTRITEETANRLAALLSTINLNVATIKDEIVDGTIKVEVTNLSNYIISPREYLLASGG